MPQSTDALKAHLARVKKDQLKVTLQLCLSLIRDGSLMRFQKANNAYCKRYGEHHSACFDSFYFGKRLRVCSACFGFAIEVNKNKNKKDYDI